MLRDQVRIKLKNYVTCRASHFWVSESHRSRVKNYKLWSRKIYDIDWKISCLWDNAPKTKTSSMNRQECRRLSNLTSDLTGSSEDFHRNWGSHTLQLKTINSRTSELNQVPAGNCCLSHHSGNKHAKGTDKWDYRRQHGKTTPKQCPMLAQLWQTFFLKDSPGQGANLGSS